MKNWHKSTARENFTAATATVLTTTTTTTRTTICLSGQKVWEYSE